MIFRDIASAGKPSRALGICLLTAAALLLAIEAPAVGADERKPAVATDSPRKIPFPKPDSHRGNWLQYHGRTVALTGNTADVSGKACLVCHEKNDCIACHNTTMPKDHNNFWRTRGHGLTAGANPERCLACHRQDYCVRCHNETAPRTHMGRWNAPSPAGTPGFPTHCMWCHFDGGVTPADNCVVCHKRAPHTSAPHPVSGTLNCSLCHH